MSIKVSILTAVYNGASFLNEMIDSIAKQTFTDFELVLVNDGSQDKTLELMETAAKKHSFIKIVNNSVNKGLPGALNAGLTICLAASTNRPKDNELNGGCRASDESTL